MSEAATAIDGVFVIARVGEHLLAVDIDSIDQIIPSSGEEPPAVDIETLLELAAPGGSQRMRLCMSRGHARVEIDVPRSALEIGRRLRGPCQSPALVAAVLRRCCLEGVVLDGEQGLARFIYLLDVDRLWSRLTDLSSSGPAAGLQREEEST